MDWDELQETGKTWRVRVQLADHPGQLATLATRLSEHSCNLLGVSVLPVAGDPSDAAGNVVDELVLRAPATLRSGELTALVEVPGARCVGIAPASVGDLVDTHTAVLRTAAGILSGVGTACDALGQVLGADSVALLERDAGTESGEPGTIRLDSRGHRATITMRTGEQVVAVREWAPFTDGELARVPALLVLLGFAELRTPSDLPAAPSRADESTRTAPARARRQLSSLDAQFLNAETSTTLTHVGGVTILDPADAPGGPVTVAGLRTLVGSRLHLVAPLRW
ncbi:MAG: diacylglycerol O-acyltransferase / wax synthase, partial [Pseudonocardiales bacterium]|nr:diacylglycerol O-acyltransferase / wax synthase [Pseudonocardiales bacterium]